MIFFLLLQKTTTTKLTLPFFLPSSFFLFFLLPLLPTKTHHTHTQGDPGNEQGGYVENGKVRTIPFEVMVKGDKTPVYEETLEDLGRFNDQPAIPFNAYGTLAAARSEFEANSASSQVFWLLKESELTPSGANLLDGRYAVLGYVVDGADLLADVQVGDRIDYIKVVSGGDLLVKGSGSAAPAAAAEVAEAQ